MSHSIKDCGTVPKITAPKGYVAKSIFYHNEDTGVAYVLTIARGMNWTDDLPPLWYDEMYDRWEKSFDD